MIQPEVVPQLVHYLLFQPPEHQWIVVGKPPKIVPEDLPFQLTERNHVLPSGSLAAAEKAHIVAVLEQNHWNISRSADILQIDRVTLYNKIEKFGLKKP